MNNNKELGNTGSQTASRFWLRHAVLALLGALILSGCGGGGGGGGGTGTGTGSSADTQIVITPSSALLTGAGQTKQFTAVVEKSDGTVDPSAPVAWTVVDPTAASVSASGNTATVTAVANPGFTEVVATSGSLTANASVAVATPAAQTHVLASSLVQSVSADQSELTLQSTPDTTAIQPGDDVVSRGILVKVVSVQSNGSQITLTTTPTTLSDAFTSFTFTAQGQSSTPYTATVSAAGVEITQQDALPQTLTWDQVQCTLGGQAVTPPILTGGNLTFSLIPEASFTASKASGSSGVTITGSVSMTPSVIINTPTLTFSSSLQGSLDCHVPLLGGPISSSTPVSFDDIVGINFDATPTIGFTVGLTLDSGGISFTGPQFSASQNFQAGFDWPPGATLPSPTQTLGPLTRTFTPFAISSDHSPSVTLTFTPYAKVAVGLNVALFQDTPFQVNAGGLNFAQPEIELNTQLGISSLPDSYQTDLTAYQGPSYSANLDGKVNFPIEITGALKSALNTFGFDNTGFTLPTINLFPKVTLAASPAFVLTSSGSTAASGTSIALTLAQANASLPFPEFTANDPVQFWEMGSGGSPSLLDATTLSSAGTASYDWTSTTFQAGSDEILALIFSNLFGGPAIGLPYGSNPVAITVTAGVPSATNSSISASPASIPADGATASAVTVQLYDTSGQKITVGGATVQIASTLGTVSSVTDNGNGTYTAQLTSTAAGTAVLSFTVNGVSSTNTASVSVTPLTSNITVSTTTPASGATGVSIDSAVSATFNGAIDASTLNASTFTLTGPGGAVAGTVTYNASTDTATLTPSTALAYSTTYTATITTGVTDTSGNPLASSYSWSFTTAGAVTAGEWTWESGSSTGNAPGVYGTLGQAAPTNVPGARADAVSWTDAAGNLWLFGGAGYDSTGVGFGLNDLWKYTPGTGEWTWESGSSTENAPGVYGTQGQAAPTNVPGGREGAVSWIDAAGNLWLFGGYGIDPTGANGYLNDLWKYTPATGEWTWEGGSSTVNAPGVYGTLGQAAPSNVPGARVSAVSWIDAAGNLWLFGGIGNDSTGAGGDLNDLWKYTPGTGEWTWESGSSTISASGVYGTQGQAVPTNVPGARYNAVAWIDAAGNLWLFGGAGNGSTSSGYLNDLWQYTPGTGEWTWEGGSSTAYALGVYGTLGQAAPSNVPGGRWNAVSWTDTTGNLWLFGGDGFDSTGVSSVRNDLWRYQP